MNIIEMWREPRTLEVLGQKRSSAWSQVSQGLLTPPVKISERSIAWPSNEIQAINAARIAGKSTDEIRALVAKLVAARRK